MALEITNENFQEEATEGVILLDFWAPWCGPCRMLTPVIEQLAKEYEGKAKVGKVNCDDEPELSAKFGIRAMPTLIVLKDGEVVASMMGVKPKPELAAAIDKAL